MALKIYSFIIAFLFAFTMMGQDVDEVKITPDHHQSEKTVNEDKEVCYAEADEQWQHTKHKTLKNTGVGTGVGAVIGKIFGKPGAGAVVGGAAGAYRGHKESKKDQQEFNNLYASCLRDKGYSVEVEE